ncbi:MAG: hydantoinase B/oxoprolinase family protein [Nannocystaceae bacterium]|nr:hydantoinase B/oxoprolinase family protein [Nannocystaceae bacterium]
MTTDAEIDARVDALLRGAWVRLGAGAGELPALRPIGRVAAFSDDVVRGRRHAVRAVLADTGAGWSVDLRDSSDADADAPAVDREDALLAATLAFGDALGLARPDARLGARLALTVEPRSWVGAARGSAAIARAFGVARVYDAVLGALALAWPDRARAGSCSLGAIVVARVDDGWLLDVVAGGRGADVHGDGGPWSGPVLPPGTLHGCDAITVTTALREASGGGGARRGGDGTLARYHFARAGRIEVAIDRVSNPPHGLDRAGPPEPAAVRLLLPEHEPRALAPWRAHEVPAGATVEVATAGGAGHGFPGWGIDFEWS